MMSSEDMIKRRLLEIERDFKSIGLSGDGTLRGSIEAPVGFVDHMRYEKFIEDQHAFLSQLQKRIVAKHGEAEEVKLALGLNPGDPELTRKLEDLNLEELEMRQEMAEVDTRGHKFLLENEPVDVEELVQIRKALSRERCRLLVHLRKLQILRIKLARRDHSGTSGVLESEFRAYKKMRTAEYSEDVLSPAGHCFRGQEDSCVRSDVLALDGLDSL